MCFFSGTRAGVGGTLNGIAALEILGFRSAPGTFYILATLANVAKLSCGAASRTLPHVIVNGPQFLFKSLFFGEVLIIITFIQLPHFGLAQLTISRVMTVMGFSGKVKKEIEKKRNWKDQCHEEPKPLRALDKLCGFEIHAVLYKPVQNLTLAI
jgi:hypothetical protein